MEQCDSLWPGDDDDDDNDDDDEEENAGLHQTNRK